MKLTEMDVARGTWPRRAADFFLGILRWPRLGEAAPSEAKPPLYPWEKVYPKELDWRVEIDPKPLTTVLDEAVAAYPDNFCIQFLGKRYRYKELETLVARAAKGFQALGVGKGSRVGLLLPNCPYYVICYFAVLRAGGVVVSFNPLYAERQIARQIRDSGARIMVTLNLKSMYPKVAARLEDGSLDKIVVCRMRDILPFPGSTLFALLRRKEVAATPGDEKHVRFDKLIDNDGAFSPVDIDPVGDIAIFQYTGGTTGVPKGAMLTHANLYANAVQTRMWAIGATPGAEKILGVLPLFHGFGMTAVMNLGILLGAEVVLLPRFKLDEVLSVIDREQPSLFIGVPTMFAAINGYKNLERYDLSSLDVCISGGAPMPADVQRTFEILTGCTLVEGYGLTEAGPVCTVNPVRTGNKAGSAGLPLPGTLIEITALDDPGKLLPPGARGEICVAGPQVMSGYRNRPGDNAHTLLGGRLHTGDVGYIDDDGYLYIIDRIKDLIINAGFNVYPRMVEEAIYLHPAVEETVVCGIPDTFRGEVIKAYVKLRAGQSVTAADLRAFLKDKLAPFEIPKRIEFRDELPKTMIGKFSRKQLIAEELKKQSSEGERNRQGRPLVGRLMVAEDAQGLPRQKGFPRLSSCGGD